MKYINRANKKFIEIDDANLIRPTEIENHVGEVLMFHNGFGHVYSARLKSAKPVPRNEFSYAPQECQIEIERHIDMDMCLYPDHMFSVFESVESAKNLLEGNERQRKPSIRYVAKMTEKEAEFRKKMESLTANWFAGNFGTLDKMQENYCKCDIRDMNNLDEMSVEDIVKVEEMFDNMCPAEETDEDRIARYEAIAGSMERSDYPPLDKLLAMERNGCYSYVPAFFLNGILNYLEDETITAYSVCRYSVYEHYDACGETAALVRNNPDDPKLKPFFDNLKEIENAKHWYHTDLHSLLIDDIIITGESDSSYFMLWFDRDVSDCIIERINKGHFRDIEDFNRFVVWQYMEKGGTYMQKIRQPKGFIKC